VIGRGGLLGRNVEMALVARGATWHPPCPFGWDDRKSVEAELSHACLSFADAVGSSPWQVAWCAGAGFVGSGSSYLEQETRYFARLLDGLAQLRQTRATGPGALFLASSAGGVYAGAKSPPFVEDSPVAPLAPYGWNKLEQEDLARRFGLETATPVIIGRLSNLYGPGQNLNKVQGLISQMCLRVITRQPLVLYVPLDTIRDYLFAKDAGRLVADCLDRLQAEQAGRSGATTVLKILASQQTATVATVLAQLRWITKRPLSVIVAGSPNTDRQARDLRMMSSVWPELDQQPVTTLSEGIRSVLIGILVLAGQGRLEIEALGVH
jgi:UDP-glucose 4-epimerase